MASPDLYAQAWAQLRRVLRTATTTSTATLGDDTLRHVGVDLSSLDIATGTYSDGGPRFMTPFPVEEYIRLQEACDDHDQCKIEDNTFEPLGPDDPTWRNEEPNHDVHSHGNASEVLYHLGWSSWLMHPHMHFSRWTYDILSDALGWKILTVR